MKRLALVFARGPECLEMTHPEALRAWEDATSASGLPVQATEGRRPRPRFALAAPLPQGYTSDCERLELWLTGDANVGEVAGALNRLLPAGLRVLGGEALPEAGPSLQSQLRWAEYRILLGAFAPRELDACIEGFFGRPSIPWEEAIEGKVKRFDLRSLADDLWVETSEGGTALGMRLDASTNGTGRPDSVIAGLGLPEPVAKQRTALLFSYIPEAVLLWRRAGRFENARPER